MSSPSLRDPQRPTRSLFLLPLLGLLGALTISACTTTTVVRGAEGSADGGVPADDNQASKPTERCTPSCENKECGDDGCGGNCGACTKHQACTAASKCETPVPPGVSCPPVGTVGTTAGKVAEAGTLPLAAGGSYNLRANCAKPIYMLGVTETCGICMQQLGQWTKAGGFLDQLKDDGVDVVLVSTDNSSGDPGSPQTAEALRGRFKLGNRFILGYEPEGPTGPTVSNGFITSRTNYAGARIALIMKPGNIIGATGQVDDEQEVRDALGL